MRPISVPGNSGGRDYFKRTMEARDIACWKKDVPYYCTYCATNKIPPIEMGGYPLWVTEYKQDHDAPDAWQFYKKPVLIPERYFTPLGVAKPYGD